MKSICLLTWLVMHLVMTSAGNKHRYSTGSHEYPDIFLLLDENDVLDEMLDQALMEVNGSAEEDGVKTGAENETSGESAAVPGRVEQNGDQELEDRIQEASGETVYMSGSSGYGVSGKDQNHYQAHKRPVQQMDTGCGCEGETCECCLDVDITHNSADVCVQVTLLRAELGLKFAVTWKGQTAFSKSISAVNPPSICFSIPFVRLLKGCIRFTDISYDHNKFGGCISLGLKLLSFKKEIQVGCFYTPNATSLGPKQDKHAIRDLKKFKHSITRPRKRFLEHSRMNKVTNTKH